MSADIPRLQQLWAEAFGDSQETLDAFFTTGFSEDRFHCIQQDGIPVSALYWFDCQLQGHNLAYIYAVATLKSHRGQGRAHRLMTEAHEILKKKGYAGAILVPGEPPLFPFYESLGYRTATYIRDFSCARGASSLPLTEIDTREYAQLRKNFLPANSVIQEGATLCFLQTGARFYKGQSALLCGTLENGTLQAQEFLGDPKLAPAILAALHLSWGNFRTPGPDSAFSMLLPLQAHCPRPSYFGLALD